MLIEFVKKISTADEENFNDLKDLVDNDARLADDGQLADDLALGDELGFAEDMQPESQRVDGETMNDNETTNEITGETGTEIETEPVEKSDENLEVENGIVVNYFKDNYTATSL